MMMHDGDDDIEAIGDGLPSLHDLLTVPLSFISQHTNNKS